MRRVPAEWAEGGGMNVWPEQMPVDGMPICVLNRFDGLRAGIYRDGYILGDGLADGYCSMADGERWIQLPEWMLPGQNKAP